MIFNHSFKHFWNLKENRFVIVRLPFLKIRVMSSTSSLTGKVLFSKALVRRFCKNEVFNSDECFNIFDGILLWVMMIMMIFFSGMVDQRRTTLILIFSLEQCQKFPPSEISGTLRAGFEPVQTRVQALLNEAVQ